MTIAAAKSIITVMNVQKNAYYGVDRRKYLRINACVTYSIVEDDIKETSSSSKNISAGGIAFFTRDNLDTNIILSIAVRLPDMSNLNAKVRVVWREPVKVSWDSDICYEVGVEFIRIDETDRQKISKYVFLRLDKD